MFVLGDLRQPARVPAALTWSVLGLLVMIKIFVLEVGLYNLLVPKLGFLGFGVSTASPRVLPSLISGALTVA